MSINITVVIPVWNQDKYIKQSVESTFNNNCLIEVIVLDDGSTDSTWKVLNSIKPPRHVNLVLKKQKRTKNMGLNMHTLYSMANGEYIVELGSDDYFLPGALDTLYSEAIKNVWAGMLYSGYYVKKSGQIIGQTPDPNNKYYQWIDHPEKRLLKNNFVTPPCAFKRSLYEYVKYDTTQEINEDYLFKLELSRFTKFFQIKKHLAVVRVRNDSISNNPKTKDKMIHWENVARDKVIKKYGI
jgi:glycosyltransferase involved in cell wall biosynthesis